MGVCTSKKLVDVAGATGTQQIRVVSSVRTKVPRLEPITHSSLVKSRLRRRSSASTDPEVVSGMSSPVEDATALI